MHVDTEFSLVTKPAALPRGENTLNELTLARRVIRSVRHIGAAILALDPLHERPDAVDDQHHTQHTIVVVHKLRAGARVLDGRVVVPCLGDTGRRPLAHDRTQPE